MHQRETAFLPRYASLIVLIDDAKFTQLDLPLILHPLEDIGTHRAGIDQTVAHRHHHIVVGATQTLPWRAQAAEDLLIGKRLGGRAIAAAARAAREAARCRDDVRTDGEYRAEMVEVMVRRALKMARERARQQP